MVTQGAHGAVKCIENILKKRWQFEYTNLPDCYLENKAIGREMNARSILPIGDMDKFWLDWYNQWNDALYTKITLKVDSASDLFMRIVDAYLKRLPVFVVKDAGKTPIEPNTYTAGVFLGTVEIVDVITKTLKLL